MKKFLPTVGFEPGPSAYETNVLSVELLELINIDHLKVNAFYLSFLCKLPVPSGRCNDDLSCIFLIYKCNICIVLLFDLLDVC